MQGAIQIEMPAEFLPGQRMKIFGARPATQEIHSSAAQLARARSRQEKTQAAFFDEPVDLVQEDRQALDLVDHHDPLGWSYLFGHAAGVLAELEENRGIEEIVDTVIRQGMSNQKTFSRLARPEEEVRFALEPTL